MGKLLFSRFHPRHLRTDRHHHFDTCNNAIVEAAEGSRVTNMHWNEARGPALHFRMEDTVNKMPASVEMSPGTPADRPNQTDANRYHCPNPARIRSLSMFMDRKTD